MSRATIALATLLLCWSLEAERATVTLRGQILHEDQPLPGVTVRLLERDVVLAEVVSDSDGRYSIVDPPRGYYDLMASLEGMDDATREVYVGDKDLVVEPMSLPIAAFAEDIVMSCGSPCDGEGEPTCKEYEKNRELESSVAANPRSLDQLRERYRRTASREELARIGGFLISVLAEGDDEYIRPLVESTEMLIWLAERADSVLQEDQPDYVAWCNAVGRNPSDELWVLYREAGALFDSTDPRAIPYAHRALRVKDFGLRMYAISQAGLTCDASLLRAIFDDFDSLAEDGGVDLLLGVLPCEDMALNERIVALDEDDVERLLPELVANRVEALARLRQVSP